MSRLVVVSNRIADPRKTFDWPIKSCSENCIDDDVDAETAISGVLQALSCTNREIVRFGDATGGLPMANDPAVIAYPQADPVAPVEQPEHGLQRVVAIGTAAGDLQEQVELGRGRPGRPAVGVARRVHGCAKPSDQASTIKRTLAWSRTALSRFGNSIPSVGCATQSL